VNPPPSSHSIEVYSSSLWRLCEPSSPLLSLSRTFNTCMLTPDISIRNTCKTEGLSSNGVFLKWGQLEIVQNALCNFFDESGFYNYCYWTCKEEGLWELKFSRPKFSQGSWLFFGKRMTCWDHCLHLTNIVCPSQPWIHQLIQVPLIQQWPHLLKRPEDDVITWQKNMLINNTLHLTKYYCTCAFSNHRHTMLEITRNRMN
jgi:hypothetical protein